MKQINLLPWREQLRETQKQQFIKALVISACSALVILILMHLTIAAKIDSQGYLNSMLQIQVSLLDEKTKEIKGLEKEKSEIITRMDLIRDLQANRPLVVHIFDELVRVIPDGVFLTDVKREDNKITLTGKAESNTRISMLMRNIEASQWIKQPVLSEIKTNPDQRPYTNDFTLELESVGTSIDLNAIDLSGAKNSKKVKKPDSSQPNNLAK